MNVCDLIYKKREGNILSSEEIRFLINGYTSGSIPDYQMSALAMAVFFQGMDERETADLTRAMVESGDSIDLSSISGIKVDKHSTGGVGDKTTLVLAPLISASGLPVAKMSGRALGHTGGTIDKLESIPGFRTDLSQQEFIEIVNSIGIGIVGQTDNLTPADKKLYALRDVTATVDSIPLIASSIMSKKIAGGADGILLDVKTGNGAFMEKMEDSRKLASIMVEIGKRVGRKTIAIITNMDQPLGLAIGNSLEVKEAIATLQGKGPDDLVELCLTLGAYILIIGEKVKEFKEGYNLLRESLNSGKALQQFKRLIAAQGGDVSVLEDNSLLPQAKYQIELVSTYSGYIRRIKTREIGNIAMSLGAGRATRDDLIDPAVGIILRKKHGDRVIKGDSLAIVHYNDPMLKDESLNRLGNCFEIGSKKPDNIPLIYEVLN
jgi:pyrimidine-nucleoside phosphorylase